MLLESKQHLFEDNTYRPLAMEEIDTNVHVYNRVVGVGSELWTSSSPTETALTGPCLLAFKNVFLFVCYILDQKYLILLYAGL